MDMQIGATHYALFWHAAIFFGTNFGVKLPILEGEL